jgi:hypothetical protein
VFPSYVVGFRGNQAFNYLTSFNQPLDFTTIDNLKYFRCYEGFNYMDVFNQPIIGFFDHMIDTKIDTRYVDLADPIINVQFTSLIPENDPEFVDTENYYF